MTGSHLARKLPGYPLFLEWYIRDGTISWQLILNIWADEASVR